MESEISLEKDEIKRTDFSPRPYQIELLEKAIERDLIVYLRTGSGKTHIAVMLVRALSDAIIKPYESDPSTKRSIFLANTVPLVKQQADYLAKFTPFKVSAYYGDKKIDDKIVDLWDREIWESEMRSNQILVMIPQVLVDCLEKNFIDLARINLIIFDECHHATGRHPYSILTQKCQDSPKKDDIRVLGLTASVVHKKCNLSKFKSHLNELEAKFNCKVETASIMYGEDDDQYERSKRNASLNKPKIVLLVYKSELEKGLSIHKFIAELKWQMTDMDKAFRDQVKVMKDTQAYLEDLKVSGNADPNFQYISEPSNPYRILKNELSNVESHLEELGVWSFKKAFEEFASLIRKLASVAAAGEDDPDKPKMCSWKDLAASLEHVYSQYVEKLLPKEEEDNVDKILSYSSEKLRALFQWLKAKAEKDANFHTIIFVERKSTAFYINRLLTALSQKYPFIRSDFVHGDTKINLFSNESAMDSKKQEHALEKFRLSTINVLVATNIVEEGIDIPACNMIVRFNKIHNFGSFIQSKGRARYKDSSYIIMVDSKERFDYEKDIADFVEIENDIEEKFIKEREEFIETISNDELKELHRMIPPLVKGKAVITCVSAISLINRYCASLDHDVCGALFPIYHEREYNYGKGLISFECSLRLPPNSVFNEKILSEKFRRKKFAKMDVALKMCRILNDKGEFTDNLTIQQKDDWIVPHCSLKGNETDKTSAKKIGSTKNKREYKFKFADELENNHPKIDETSYLYEIAIEESAIDQSSDFEPIVSKTLNFGLLSSKYFEAVPEFKLYKNNSQFSIRIKCVNSKVKLNQRQFDSLLRFNTFLFTEILNMGDLENFEKKVCGGFFLTLKDTSIDWDYLDSLDLNKTVYEELKNRRDLKGFLVKSRFRQTIMRIHEICSNTKASSPSPVKDFAGSFADYFFQKHAIKTNDENQPMIEIKQIVSFGFNFLHKNDQIKTSKKEKNPTYKQLFVGEHLNFIPFKESDLVKMHMIPNIFFRLNSLLKARKFQALMEREITQALKIQQKYNNLGWEESIRFNKSDNNENHETEKELDASTISSNSSSVDEENGVLFVTDDINKDINAEENDENNNNDQASKKTPPPLIFKEATDLKDPSLFFPNIYNLLQCFTLKTSSDTFDLERYEILGDCYLKLIAVLNIYAEFSSTQEGKMVMLKSMRVSNRYLFELAEKKRLHEFIVGENCNQKENCLGPWTRVEDDKLTLKLADKSLADCVEALIGCYLICLGAPAAKVFIDWLDYVISDKKGKANFTATRIEEKLRAPVLKPEIETKLAIQYREFEANCLGYEFKNRAYLYQAFTHPSDMNNTVTSSYQKLELVGDAVLDMLITQYIFSDPKEHSPGELTDLRQALVNNNFFGSLAVKHRFHVHLSFSSPAVQKLRDDFVKKSDQYSSDAAYLHPDIDIDEFEIEPPKFLADIFESVAGAIYLDSNCNLNTVWNVYYKFFEPYLEAFKRNLPQSPIKLLNQLRPTADIDIEARNVELEEGALCYYEVVLRVDGQEFIGKGENKSLAKKGAFKRAVRALQKPGSPKYIFF